MNEVHDVLFLDFSTFIDFNFAQFYFEADIHIYLQKDIYLFLIQTFCWLFQSSEAPVTFPIVYEMARSSGILWLKTHSTGQPASSTSTLHSYGGQVHHCFPLVVVRTNASKGDSAGNLFLLEWKMVLEIRTGWVSNVALGTLPEGSGPENFSSDPPQAALRHRADSRCMYMCVCLGGALHRASPSDKWAPALVWGRSFPDSPVQIGLFPGLWLNCIGMAL